MSIIYQYFLRESCIFSLMHNSAAIFFVHLAMVKQKTGFTRISLNPDKTGFP